MTLAWPLRSVIAGAAGTATMTARLRRRAAAAQEPARPARLRRLARPRPDRRDGDAPAARHRPGGPRARPRCCAGATARRSASCTARCVAPSGSPGPAPLFGGTLMTATMTLFPLLGRTPPPWRWPPDMLATSLGTHAAYVAGGRRGRRRGPPGPRRLGVSPRQVVRSVDGRQLRWVGQRGFGTRPNCTHITASHARCLDQPPQRDTSDTSRAARRRCAVEAPQRGLNETASPHAVADERSRRRPHLPLTFAGADCTLRANNVPGTHN